MQRNDVQWNYKSGKSQATLHSCVDNTQYDNIPYGNVLYIVVAGVALNKTSDYESTGELSISTNESLGGR